MLNSCKNKDEKAEETPVEVEKIAYKSFGNTIIADDAIAASSMATHYKTMNVGDSINSKMTATVNKVCQAKGCWMTLNLGDEQEVMLKAALDYRATSTCPALPAGRAGALDMEGDLKNDPRYIKRELLEQIRVDHLLRVSQ